MSDSNLLSNRYLLDKPLGNGGMAIVYRARDLTLERTVAIKILKDDYSRDADFRARFRQEAMAAANLTHPNIVTVHDFGIDGEQVFFVMEYVPGTNLKAILEKRGRFSVEEALPLIRQACAGIGYAHRAGLVHCDIKPHNFLITPDNHLKVADFGIARALASYNPTEKNKVVWGSPQYISPEQAAGEAPIPASDVYSLGVVMYYMLTGRLPFTATKATELFQLHLTSQPVSPRQYNPSIPVELEKIILKVLSKESSSRYRTAGQLELVLESVQGIETSKTLAETQFTSLPLAETQPLEPAKTKKPLGSTTPPPPHRSSLIVKKPQKSQLPIGDTSYNPFDIDWVALILGLIALIAVGGLIPFWLWVYLVYNPPGR